MTRPVPPSGHFVDLGVFGSATLRERRVRAYVPRLRARQTQGRADAPALEPRRALLVLFDGQNVFDDEGAYAGGWHAHGAADRLASVQAPAIVAIDHGGDERIEELGAPWSPKLAALIELIVDGVLPLAHEKLALADGPAAHFVGGSSMGGLAALYTHFRRPDVFGGALCMSPSFWYQNRAVFEFVAKEPNPWRSRIYLDAGAREARGRLTKLVGEMATHLEGRGWGRTGDLRLMFRADRKGTHDESHWRRRLPKALRFLLAP